MQAADIAIPAPHAADRRIRNPLLVVVLSLVTLGLYGVWWWYSINRDMAEIGRRRRLPGLGDQPVVSAIALVAGWLLIVPAVWTFVTTTARVHRTQRALGVAPLNPWIFAPVAILTAGLGGMIMLQQALNAAVRADAEAPASAPEPRADTPAAAPAAMSAEIDGHALWQQTELEIVCSRSSAGQTTEVLTPTRELLARSDREGAIADAHGTPLLDARTEDDNRRAWLELRDVAGRPVAGVRVARYTFAGLSMKATLEVADPAGALLARFESRDRKGREIAITTPAGGEVAVMREVDRDRGVRRSSATYRLEVGPDITEALRPIVVATAMRYQSLLVRHQHATSSD